MTRQIAHNSTGAAKQSLAGHHLSRFAHNYTLKILAGLIQILVLLPIIHSISSFYHQPPLPQWYRSQLNSMSLPCLNTFLYLLFVWSIFSSSHKSGCPTGLQNLDICYDSMPCGALLG
ncbi:hypothetical protein VPH35_007408 [Triticum aestivum]